MFTQTTHNIFCGIICSLILLACIVLIMLAAAGPQFKYARRDFSTLIAISSDAESPPKPPGAVVVNNGHHSSSFTWQPPTNDGK